MDEETFHQGGESSNPEALELESLSRNQGVHDPEGGLLITMDQQESRNRAHSLTKSNLFVIARVGPQDIEEPHLALIVCGNIVSNTREKEEEE